MGVAEQVYEYARPSTVAIAPGGTADVLLGTSGGPTAHPHFFSGFVAHGAQTARALLLVADIAGTRFYEPPSMVAARLRAADPVVTSGPDVLRFESFSACCGVYARLDLDGGSLDPEHSRMGTTNVDLNPAFRTALAQVGRDDPIHLGVGSDELRLRTLDGEAVERRVPLPDRWVKGFGEVPALTAGFSLRLEVGATEARRFLHGLRPGPVQRGASWVVPSGRGLRVSGRATPDAVCLAGPQRLRLLGHLLTDIQGLRAYGPEPDAGTRRPAEAGAWELVLRDARLVVVASADASRGFSGEGAVLEPLAAADDDLDERVEALAVARGLLTATEAATALGAAPDAVRLALGRTAAAGRLGHDLGAAAFFPRPLPFDPERLAALHPRLAGARRLVETGAVTLDGDHAAHVRSRDVTHRVSGLPDAPRCTCPWYGRHAGDRGPCKHVLAATIALQEETPP